MIADATALFDGSGTPTYAPAELRSMVRNTDDLPAGKQAAKDARTRVQTGRLLVLRLLVENHPNPLTMFCPFVLTNRDPRCKQTAVGPRFRKLRLDGLIQHIGEMQPRDGAESRNWVSAFLITDKGRDYLAAAETQP